MPPSPMVDLQNWHDAGAKRGKRARVQLVQGARKRDRQPAGRRVWLWRSLLALGCLALFAVTAAWMAKRYVQSFAVQTVSIDGEFHNEQAHQVKSTLLPYVKGDFFTVDLAGGRQALLQLSWVRDVSLRRRWPNEVVVDIREQVPRAVWNGSAYLNAGAEGFRHPYTEAAGLPQLSGPAGSERRVMERFRQWRTQFARAGLQLQSVRLDERYSWTVSLDNGITIRLGKDHLEHRLQRFMQVFPDHLLAEMARIRSIDLRYSNGFAVGWKSARISHPPSAAAADPLAVAGRTPSSRLDVASTTPAPSSSPCAPPQRRLDALATKSGKKCRPWGTHATVEESDRDV